MELTAVQQQIDHLVGVSKPARVTASDHDRTWTQIVNPLRCVSRVIQ